MMRTPCTFLVLSRVAGLSGVLTSHLWNRYADENGLLRLGGIYQRIVAAQAGLVELGYSAATDTQIRLIWEVSAFEE